MSYCRFSSDDWKCDVYVYEADEGMTIHVAASRRTGEIPPLPSFSSVPADVWVDAYLKQMEAVKVSKSQRIGGPFDGQGFYGLSYQDALEKLETISQSGYNVPAYVLEALREDIASEGLTSHE